MNPSMISLEQLYGEKRSPELFIFSLHTLENRLQPKRKAGKISSHTEDVDKSHSSADPVLE